MVNTAELQAIKREADALIDSYGNLVTINTPGTKTYDVYGQPVYAVGTTRQVQAVTDQWLLTSFKNGSWGKISKGSLVFVFKGDVALEANETITVRSKTYKVQNINYIQAADVLVVLQVEVAE